MSHLKKLIYFVLAASFLLMTACNAGGNSEQKAPEQAGRYVESDITPPIDGRFMSFSGRDGTLVCFDDGLRNRYESADGGASWSLTPGPGRDTDRYMTIRSGAMLQDGSLLVFLQDLDKRFLNSLPVHLFLLQ